MSARSLLLAALLLAALLAPSAAHAVSVSYVDGGEVWVSSLDGSVKQRLTQPGALGAGQWQGTAQSDDGHVAAFRREGSSMFPFFGLWSSNGALVNTSALPYETGWTVYVMPTGFDLSPDGTLLAYGYSNTSGIVPNMVFGRGHYVINAPQTKTLLRPYAQSGQEWPTFFGRRIVASDGSSLVSVQDAGGSPPFQPTFAPWISLGTGLEPLRADVAANGSVVGIDVRPSSGDDKILMVQASGGVGGAIGDDCWLPTAASPRDVSLSLDGARVAWADAEGVKVAGTPRFDGPATCNLTAPPVTISASGKGPAIGGATVSAISPPGAGGSGGGTGGTGSGGGAAVAIAPPARASTAALARGVRVTVTVRAAGRVTLVATAPARALGLRGRRAVVVARGSAVARRAGSVAIVLRPTRAARGRLGRLAGRTLALTATGPGGSRATARLKLRAARARAAAKVPAGPRIRVPRMTSYPVTVDAAGYLDYDWTFDDRQDCAPGYRTAVQEHASFELGRPRRANLTLVGGVVATSAAFGGEARHTARVDFATTNYCPPLDPAAEPDAPTCERLEGTLGISLSPEPLDEEEDLVPLVRGVMLNVYRKGGGLQDMTCFADRPEIAPVREGEIIQTLPFTGVGMSLRLGATDRTFWKLKPGRRIQRSIAISGRCDGVRARASALGDRVTLCKVAGRVVVTIRRVAARRRR